MVVKLDLTIIRQYHGPHPKIMSVGAIQLSGGDAVKATKIINNLAKILHLNNITDFDQTVEANQPLHASNKIYNKPTVGNDCLVKLVVRLWPRRIQ